MTVRDPFVLGSGNTDADNLVDKLIGNAYQVVKYVAINMRGLIVISDNMVKISAVYDNLAALQSIQQNLEMLNVVAENAVPLAALGAEIDKLLAIYANLTAIANVSANMPDVVAVADKLPELTLIATQLDAIIDTLDNLSGTGGANMVGTADGITVQAALYSRYTKEDMDGVVGSEHVGHLRVGASVPVKVRQVLRELEAAYGGMKAKIVAFVLRNYGTAGAPDWKFIEDDNHTKMNGATVVMNGRKLQVNFSGQYKKAISFVAAPDESMAALGYTIGASVGTANVLIEVGQRMQGFVNLQSGLISLNDPQLWPAADFSGDVNSTTGVVTVNHPANGGFLQQAWLKEPGSAYPLTHLSVLKGDATKFTLRPYRQLGGYVRYNGVAWEVLTSTVAGVTVAEAGGVLTVSHPAIPADVPAIVSTRFNDSFLAHGDSVDTTNFVVKFNNLSGVQQTVASNKMAFSFMRPANLPVKAPVQGEAYFDAGYGTVDMSRLVVPGGNIWCIGVFEDN